MTLTLRPLGRGNWRKLVLEIAVPADLFPAVRERQVQARERWFMAGRWWRILEVRP
jgi:hypothetical protein